jgi:hypothetical protein
VKRVGATVLSAAVTLVAAGGSAVGQEPERPAAVCPTPPPPDFDFWLGAWDVANRQRQPTGDDPVWYDTGTATATITSAVGGCAIVEHWWGDLSFDQLRGFSVRAFDHDRGLWTAAILWPGPNQPSFGQLEGTFHHARGEFFTSRTDQNGRTTITRFTFTDIQPTTMRWDAAASGDSGISWRPSWIMEFTRRAPDAGAPRPAWADSVARCDFPEMYEFDFVIGEWTGSGSVAGGESQPARLTSRRSVGNCAIEDRLVIGDAFEAFEIRAHVPRVDGWVGYRLDSSRPTLQHLEGSVRGGDAQLAGSRAAPGDREIMVMERWRWRGETALTYDVRESSDGGQTWASRVQADLRKDTGSTR